MSKAKPPGEIDKSYYTPSEIAEIKRGTLFVGTMDEWLSRCKRVGIETQKAIAIRAEERKDEIAEFHRMTGGKYRG